MEKKDSWTHDCPMIFREYIKFFDSNKSVLLVFVDKNGEHRSSIFNEIPNKEEIFKKSKQLGDYRIAIFQRDFNKEVDIEDLNSLDNALILIDECEFK